MDLNEKLELKDIEKVSGGTAQDDGKKLKERYLSWICPECGYKNTKEIDSDFDVCQSCGYRRN